MTRARRCLAAALAGVALSAPLAAGSGVLVPREVFVGDSAELTFETNAFASVLESGTVLTVPSADLPVFPDATIESIRVMPSLTGKSGIASVSIRFVPWIAGALTLPSFTLNKIRLTPPPVRITSLIDKTGRAALEGPRSPLLIPGTTYLLYGAIAVGLAAVTALLVLLVRLRRYLLQNTGRKQSGRRVRLALRQLKALDRNRQKLEIGPWYERYSFIVRSYLGAFCAGSPDFFSSSTGTEIIDGLRLPLDGHDAGDLLSGVRGLLGRVDIIRFSGRPAEDRRSEDIQTIRDLIPLLESVAVPADFESTGEAEAADDQL